MIGHLFVLLLCLKHVLNEVVLSFKTSLKQTGSDIIDLSVCEHVYFFSCQQTVFNLSISTGELFLGWTFGWTFGWANFRWTIPRCMFLVGYLFVSRVVVKRFPEFLFFEFLSNALGYVGPLPPLRQGLGLLARSKRMNTDGN